MATEGFLSSFSNMMWIVGENEGDVGWGRGYPLRSSGVRLTFSINLPLGRNVFYTFTSIALVWCTSRE